jgi:neutral ceramidase
MIGQAGADLRAGAAMADITPRLGIQIAGDIGRYRPVEEIRDPLFARALVIESGARRMCWLSLDILAITRRWAGEIRRQAAARFGLEPQAIMVHVVQNHAAPSAGHFFVFDEDDWGLFPKEYPWLLGGDERYNAVCVDGALSAIGNAVAGLRPATVHAGRGVDGRVAFNRRFIMRDGTGLAEPGLRAEPGQTNPDILYCEGPADPEVGVMTFTGEDGRVFAALLHHTSHPGHGYPERWISAGWPGAWCNGVRGLLGSDCVAVLVNGFCGNVHHRNHLDPDYRDDHLDMGRKLTETTARVLKRMVPFTRPILDWRTRSLQIPMRTPTDDEVADASRLLAEHPEPLWTDASRTAVEWDWVYAVTRIDLAEHVRKAPRFDYPIQVFRLGEMALVSVPGEPFVQEQLRIKQASPAAFTFMAHMSNTYVGYIPTTEAFRNGGYETRTGAGSKLAPEALASIGDAVIGMLGDLFARRPVE